MRVPPRIRLISLTLALWAAILFQPAPVRAQAHGSSAAPRVCTSLVAALQSTATGPESEDRPDTERLQAALTACPAGQVVVLDRAGPANSFLSGPIDVPAGVLLQLNPGVVLWAVRDFGAFHAADGTGVGVSRALITMHNEAASTLTTGIAGWGVVDGRGSALLLRSSAGSQSNPRTWADLPQAARPALIEGFGPVTLDGPALRDAPGTAVRLYGAAAAQLQNLTIAGGLHGIALIGASSGLRFDHSTISTRGVQIDAGAADGSAFTISQVHLFGGTGLVRQGGSTVPATACTLTWAGGGLPVCIAEPGPAWTGALLLGPGARSAGASTLSAVLRATEFPAPIPAGSVRFFAGTELLGSAPIDSAGVAEIELPTLAPDPAGLHADFGGATLLLTPHTLAHSRDLGQLTPSTLSLSTSGTHFLARDVVGVAAAISPASATGTVQLLDSGQLIDAQPVQAGGTAYFAMTTLAVRGHLLSAAYMGDTATLPATSPAVAITVTPDPVTLTIAPPPAPVLFGSAVALVATAEPSAASGNVVFGDSNASVPLGSAPLAGGSASFTATRLPVGTHLLHASYGGDLLDQAAASPPVSVTIDPLPTAITLANMPAQLFFGQTLAASLSVTSPAANAEIATGAVTIADVAGGQPPIRIPISGSAAPIRFTDLAPGRHLFVASYPGDATHAASMTSVGASLEVLPAPTVLSVVTATPAPAPGTPITLTASVTPASTGGTVIFHESTRGTLGTAPLAGGSATFTIPGLPAGTYAVSASTPGDARYAAGASSPVSLIVAAAPTLTTLGPLPPSISFGRALTLAATVQNSAGSTQQPPTGVVDLFDGNALLGSAPVIGGGASWPAPLLTPGQHSLRAAYEGDATHAASTSAAVLLTLTSGQPQISLTLSEAAVPAGDAVFVNIAVEGLPGAPPPGGTITVRAGARVLGAKPLERIVGATAYTTLPLDTAALGIGTLPLSAFFSGDADYAAADSSRSPTTLNIVPIAVSATLTLSSASVVAGTPTPLSVRVARVIPSPTGPPTPTGSIVFARDNTPFATVPLGPNGMSSATLPGLPAGAFHLSASFLPTGFFAASSSAVTLAVTPPLGLALHPNTVDLTAASHVDAALTLYPLSGFSGAITGSCTSPVARLTCTLDLPAGVNGAPTNGTVHLTLTSTEAKPARAGAGSALTGVLLSLLVLGPRALQQRKRLRLRAALLAGLLLAGCGPEGGDFPFGNTSHGAVTVTLKAAGSSETIALPYTLPN